MKPGLTEREQILLNAIKKYLAEHPYPPSIRDLIEMTGIGGTSVVLHYLVNLEEKGKITRVEGQARSISVVSEK